LAGRPLGEDHGPRGADQLGRDRLRLLQGLPVLVREGAGPPGLLTRAHRARDRGCAGVVPRERLPAVTLHVGTSGWHYAGWWGPFFPEDVKKKDALAYYASRFTACELNAPFYRTPTLEAVRGWRAATPRHFRFAWKASKFITHWKRLSAKSANSLELLESRLEELGPKLGPVLFQLPPRFEKNVERLAGFLEMLAPRRRYVFEFRHPSWYDDEVYALLRRRRVAL